MVTIVGQDAAGNHQRVPISPIAPKGEVPKPWGGPYFPYFPYFGGLCLLILPRHGPPNRDPLMVLPGWSAKTMRGSLFPLLPLRVKCQNHERVPISPISPILVVHVLARWEDIDHQNRGNRGNRDPLMVLALAIGEIGTLSAFSLGEVPKPWESLYFPYFGGPCLDKMKRHGPPK